jgi:hypothetical protein
MATFTLFHEALKFIGDGTIDLDSHSFKAYLSNAAPNQATNTVKTDIAEIAAGNGYTTGGFTLAVTYTETGAGTGVWRFNSNDPSWTASGGSIATHQYLIVYDDTAASDQLLGYVNRGTSDVIADGNTRTWDVGSSGLFEVSATP